MINHYLKMLTSRQGIKSAISCDRYADASAVSHSASSTAPPINEPPLQTPRNRLIGWSKEMQQLPDMSLLWTCCGAPTLDPVKNDLGFVDQLHLSIQSCTHCGRIWLAVRPQKTGQLRFVPLSLAMAETFVIYNTSADREMLLKKRLASLLP